MVGYPTVLAWCQNLLVLLVRELEYLFPPKENKVRVCCVAFVRAFTCCSSPDFLVPFVICNCRHFILGKMPVKAVSCDYEYRRGNTYNACLTPIGLLINEVVVVAAYSGNLVTSLTSL